MPNPYFNNQRTFIPNTLIKSEEANAQFNDVENGFDLIDEKVTEVEGNVTTINNNLNEVINEVDNLMQDVNTIINNGGGGGGGTPGSVENAPTLIAFSQAIPFDGNYIMQTTDASIPLNFTVDQSKPSKIGAKVRLTMIGRGRFDEVGFTGINLMPNGFREPFFHQWGVKNVMTFEYDGTSYTCRIEKALNDFGGATYVGTDPSYVVFEERQGFYSAPANRFIYAIKDHRHIDTPFPQTAYLEGVSYEYALSEEERVFAAKPDDTIRIRNGQSVGKVEICYMTGSQHSLVADTRFEFSVSNLSGANVDTPPALIFSTGRFDTYYLTPDNENNALRERVYLNIPSIFFAADAYFTSNIPVFANSTIDFDVYGSTLISDEASISNVAFGNVAGIYRAVDGRLFLYSRSLVTGQVLRQAPIGSAVAELWPHVSMSAIQAANSYPAVMSDGGIDFLQKLSGPPPGLTF